MKTSVSSTEWHGGSDDKKRISDDTIRETDIRTLLTTQSVNAIKLETFIQIKAN